MVRIAPELTKDIDRNGTPDQYGIFIGSHFVEVIEQMNHAPIERNALSFSLTKESVEAYTAYLRLLDARVMPDIRRVQAMGMQAPQMMQTGRVAMLVEAVPHQTLYESLTIRWGVAPLPRFAGKTPRYFRSGSGGLSVSAHTRNPEAAWKALKWIIARCKYLPTESCSSRCRLRRRLGAALSPAEGERFQRGVEPKSAVQRRGPAAICSVFQLDCRLDSGATSAKARSTVGPTNHRRATPERRAGHKRQCPTRTG